MGALLLDKNVATERDSEMTALLDRARPGGFHSIAPNRLWLNSLLPFGNEDTSGGYGTEGDIVYTTKDGVDINSLWDEAQQALAVWNRGRSRLVEILTFPVTNEIETVPQVGEAAFEVATEFGEPQGERLKLGYFQLGFDFEDYDRATRFSWKALRDMDARQVRAVNNALLQADEKLVFKLVMASVFDNRDRETDIRNQAYKVYPLYNGDGVAPPSYRGKTFTGSHSHYMVSGNTVIDSGDLEDAYENIAEHGYTIEAGTQIVVLMNRNQLREIRKFRMNQENNNGAVAEYDFIPSRNQPAQFTEPTGLLGSLPPDTWNGLRVYGSYGDMLLVEEPFMPDGYFLMLGTGGIGNLQNLVGLREHANPVYRGLRIIPGNDQRYPLIESYYTRAFGTGIRQRAGAVVMQIKPGTNANYEIPTLYDRTDPGFMLW
ncbi:major head protein [Mycobacterium phage Indlulamithi]|uniref:Major capsid protein n=1 Tax=Mycobacterium phage Indlulamithi TaxID=2656582 RepID=A0A649VE49_9CAUD|nr:major head protein [Mycobacterium phage Indlulamithi]QGJ90053.1 major capsid protein [Mycobacterium phage Indlulamithi]